MKELHKIAFTLQLFANPNTQTTNLNATGNDLSDEMKTFYKTSLLENARNEHFFAQFGKKQPLPKNGGKKVEWRKFDTLGKALTPLTEGVTPDGNSVNVVAIEKEINQYGDYVTISDRLEMEAVDPVIMTVTEEIGAEAGDTVDTLIRNEVVAGTNVFYAGTNKTARNEVAKTDVLTSTLVNKVVTFLKKMKAPTINGDYIAIIHPSVSFDLRESAGWLDVHKYAEPTEIFNGEIGKLHGCRFIEDTEQKIWKADNLTANARNLTLKTALDGTGSTTVAVKEAISADEATALAGRKIILGGEVIEIASATSGAAGSASLTASTTVKSKAADSVIYPGEVGTTGNCVYATLFFGKDAYGIIEPSAESLEVIVKQKGSAGTDDPLDQRSTVGFKVSTASKILYQERIIRVESGSDFADDDDAN